MFIFLNAVAYADDCHGVMIKNGFELALIKNY